MGSMTDALEEPSVARKLTSELLGTFLLVFGGTGAAVLAATFPDTGIGFAGVAFAFGIAVLAGVYSFGPISGGHFNPAVTLGLAVGGRFPWKGVLPYVGAQLVGAILGSLCVLAIANGAPGGYDASASGLAANGYGAHSPGGLGLGAGFLSEVFLTFLFVSVIFACTAKRAAPGFAGLAIGLTLALVHLVGIPVTNVSVNPARSTAPALFVGGWALAQLWLFWLAPAIGAAIAGLLGRWLHAVERTPVRERVGRERPLAHTEPTTVG